MTTVGCFVRRLEQPGADVGLVRRDDALEVEPVGDIDAGGSRDAARADGAAEIAPAEAGREESSLAGLDPREERAHQSRLAGDHRGRVGDRVQRRDAARRSGVEGGGDENDPGVQVAYCPMLVGPVLAPGEQGGDRGQGDHRDRGSGDQAAPEHRRGAQKQAVDGTGAVESARQSAAA